MDAQMCTQKFTQQMFFQLCSIESMGPVRQRSVFAADTWHRMDRLEVAAAAGGLNKTSVVKVGLFLFPSYLKVTLSWLCTSRRASSQTSFNYINSYYSDWHRKHGQNYRLCWNGVNLCSSINLKFSSCHTVRVGHKIFYVITQFKHNTFICYVQINDLEFGYHSKYSALHCKKKICAVLWCISA